MLTPKQIKAARALLDWSQKVLGEKCDGVSEPTIKLIENEKIHSTPGTLGIIRKTFEDHGVEFLPHHGVKMRSSEMRTYEGQQGFVDFYEEIYQTLRIAKDRHVYVSNVDEKEFVHWLGEDNAEKHIRRMKELEVHSSIIIKEGDEYTPGTEFAEYRSLSKELTGTVPFYVFGDKLAIILFTDHPKVFILHNNIIADAYKAQFRALWEQAK